MKFLIKKIYIVLFLLVILLTTNKIFARDNKIQYAEEDISNYFSGILLLNENQYDESFKFLRKLNGLH